MKKKLIITIVIFSAMMAVNAQNKKSSKFGIRAGWQSAEMIRDGKSLETTEPLNSFYVGVFKEKKLIPMLHFGGGVEYFQNGFQSKLIDYQRKLHYISVPLYLKAKLGPVYATGGTALSFKVSESNVIFDGVTDPIGEKSNVFDMPLQLGLGIKILMISIEGRYNWGLLDINNGVKNRYFQLGLGMSF